LVAELLRLENVWAGYGDATVLEDISFAIEEGQSMALLGRNGMGKTTLLATLMGATRLRNGRMVYQGGDLAAVPSHRRAHVGFGWVPQERDIFPSLTVEENLTVVARPGQWDLDRVYATFPRLHERRRNMGNQLSGGEQQMLAMGRALMLNPKILLLDEPLEGLAPIIVQELLQIIEKMVTAGGMAVILVEQHARQILPITRKAIVLERGRIVYQGESSALAADPELLGSWLGVVAKSKSKKINALDIIREEHRALAAVLHGLGYVVDGIEEKQLATDYQLLSAMIEYITEVPEKVHHPKEDGYLFLKLRQRSPEAAPILDELESDHRKGPAMINGLNRALIHYVQAGEAGFPAFRDTVRSFIASQWQHMNKEEGQLMPMARQVLLPEDWAEIDTAFAANGSPWSGPAGEYAQLFSRIANLAPAPIGFGPGGSPS
jgi:ABC-type branched-subunit amino acid transport system ATPase component/hemerythrin-like domain-containing protein